MNAEVFLDSNILVYAAMARSGEEFKRERALTLIQSEHFGTSAQVLQEFYVTVVRKAKRPLTSVEAMEWIQQWAAFPCQPIDRELVQIAIEMSVRYKIGYWDAAIIAAATSLGAHILYSEDLNNRQRYGSVRVVNPFS